MKTHILFTDEDGVEYIKEIKDLSLIKNPKTKEYAIECGTEWFGLTKKEHERLKKILLNMESNK